MQRANSLQPIHEFDIFTPKHVRALAFKVWNSENVAFILPLTDEILTMVKNHRHAFDTENYQVNDWRFQSSAPFEPECFYKIIRETGIKNLINITVRKKE